MQKTCKKLQPFCWKTIMKTSILLLKNYHTQYSKQFSNIVNIGIIAISNVTNRWTFQFSCVSVDDVSKEINNLSTRSLREKCLYSVLFSLVD